MTEVIEKFEVHNRWTNAVQFTAEISVKPDMSYAVKLGLAVKWGVKAGANLAGASLDGAYLARANLAGASLDGAYLARANLAGANLAGAKLSEDITISKTPIQIQGVGPWPVIIFDQHMKIGCQFHSLAEWEAFDNREIIAMDGRDAAKFWAVNKDLLLALARAHGRSFEPFNPTSTTTPTPERAAS